MVIRAGRYTLSLTMIVCGVLMLLNSLSGVGVFKDLWVYSPVILILFGLEIILLNFFYSDKERYKVEIGAGNILMVIILIAVFIVGTNQIRIDTPVVKHFFINI